jgi:hypothetical protein
MSSSGLPSSRSKSNPAEPSVITISDDDYEPAEDDDDDEVVVIQGSLNVNLAAGTAAAAVVNNSENNKMLAGAGDGISVGRSQKMEDDKEVTAIIDVDDDDVTGTGGGEEKVVVIGKDVVEALPDTVTVLKSGNVTVYLVGTAHFSEQSQTDVRTVIFNCSHGNSLVICNSNQMN